MAIPTVAFFPTLILYMLIAVTVPTFNTLPVTLVVTSVSTTSSILQIKFGGCQTRRAQYN